MQQCKFEGIRQYRTTYHRSTLKKVVVTIVPMFPFRQGQRLVSIQIIDVVSPAVILSGEYLDERLTKSVSSPLPILANDKPMHKCVL